MADAFVGVLKHSVESNAVKEHRKRLLTCELGSFVVLGWGLPLLLRISHIGVHSEFVGHQICFVRETLSTDSAGAWTVLMFDEAFGCHCDSGGLLPRCEYARNFSQISYKSFHFHMTSFAISRPQNGRRVNRG